MNVTSYLLKINNYITFINSTLENNKNIKQWEELEINSEVFESIQIYTHIDELPVFMGYDLFGLLEILDN